MVPTPSRASSAGSDEPMLPTPAIRTLLSERGLLGAGLSDKGFLPVGAPRGGVVERGGVVAEAARRGVRPARLGALLVEPAGAAGALHPQHLLADDAAADRARRQAGAVVRNVGDDRRHAL